MSSITEFEKALMHRDGDTRLEAKKHREEAMAMVCDTLAAGGGYDEIEDLLACEYGLEMDYILDLL